MTLHNLPAPELAQWLDDASRSAPLLLDVREPWEVQTCALPGVVHIPMHEIPNRINELPDDKDIVCICHHGMRSMQVALYLQHQGFENLYNLSGGMHAWAVQVDPSCPTY